VLLDEANEAARAVKLPVLAPIKVSDLRSYDVDLLAHGTTFMGDLHTEKYDFGFSPYQQLRLLRAIHLPKYPASKGGSNKSGLGTNEAYQIVTNWLYKLSIDKQELDRIGKLEIGYWVPEDSKDDAGFYTLVWHSLDGPQCSITLSAGTKELVSFFIRDDNSISHRPAPLINNLHELLKISDREFLKYSDEERSNLVNKFATGKERL